MGLLVRWGTEEGRIDGVMDSDYLPVGIARAHWGITRLSVTMDAGRAVGLNCEVVQLPAHSVESVSD